MLMRAICSCETEVSYSEIILCIAHTLLHRRTVLLLLDIACMVEPYFLSMAYLLVDTLLAQACHVHVIGGMLVRFQPIPTRDNAVDAAGITTRLYTDLGIPGTTPSILRPSSRTVKGCATLTESIASRHQKTPPEPLAWQLLPLQLYQECSTCAQNKQLQLPRPSHLLSCSMHPPPGTRLNHLTTAQILKHWLLPS